MATHGCCGSWTNTIISGISNLSTAYNLIIINIVHVLVERQYCGGSYCASGVTLASTTSLLGCSVGQLSFGTIGDCLGRSRALQLTMALTIFGALVSACAVPITSDPASIFTFLGISRFVMGVGVGGVYPLTATIAAESSSDGNRGRMTSLVFSMQGVAYLTAPCIAMMFIAICGPGSVMKIGDDPTGDGWAWRLTLAFGAVPGILLIPFRASETKDAGPSTRAEGTSQELGELSVLPDVTLPSPPKLSWKEGIMEAWNLKAEEGGVSGKGKMLGTAGGWFLFDFTFYGNNLFQASVLRYVFDSNNDSSLQSVTGDLDQDLCKQMAIIALIALPGYYFAVALTDYFGRRAVQLQGFFMMTIIYACLGIFYEELLESPTWLLTLYGLSFFFSNFGPNSTTFIVAAESYPQEVRSTMHGFSASTGMIGAALGSALFTPLISCYSCSAMDPVAFMMIICSCVAAAGFLVTYFFVMDCRGAMVESPRGKGNVKGYGTLVDEEVSDKKIIADMEQQLQPGRQPKV